MGAAVTGTDAAPTEAPAPDAARAPDRRQPALQEDAAAALALLVGVVLLRLAFGGLYLRFVKPVMLPWLVLAGVVFSVLGGLGLVRALRARRDHAGGHEDDHGEAAPALDAHGHAGSPRVAALLLVPVLAVFLVSPAGLGSFAAARVTRASTAYAGTPPPLRPGPDGVVTLPIGEYAGRIATGGSGMRGASVRLVGFVSHPPDTSGGSGFLITRFKIACCAADAETVQVAVEGLPSDPPANDTWVEVVGTPDLTRPTEPMLQARSLRAVPQPSDPYES